MRIQTELSGLCWKSGVRNKKGPGLQLYKRPMGYLSLPFEVYYIHINVQICYPNLDNSEIKRGWVLLKIMPA